MILGEKMLELREKKYAECMSESGAYTWSGIYAVNQSMRDWIAKQIQENIDCTKRLSK